MNRLRTFGIVAHIDAGKTTLTERILFDTGAQSWLGSVDDGTATMDFMPAERSRGISITSAASRVAWGDHALQARFSAGTQYLKSAKRFGLLRYRGEMLHEGHGAACESGKQA